MTNINSGADYGFNATLNGVSVAEAVPKITEALAAQGFGVLTTIDIQATFKKKLDADVAPYVILGACNPQLASAALHVEPSLGLLLPCNVVVREVEGGTLIEIVDPKAMFQVVHNPDLDAAAEDAGARLKAALDAVAG